MSGFWFYRGFGSCGCLHGRDHRLLGLGGCGGGDVVVVVVVGRVIIVDGGIVEVGVGESGKVCAKRC